jgi:DNA-binding transcriptional MerR regulator
MSTQILRVHQVAEAVGVSKDTIRRHEAAGILEPAPRDIHGWRVYTPQQVERIRHTLFPFTAEPDNAA